MFVLWCMCVYNLRFTFSVEIDQNEARVNSLRSAIIETFPEPNRRLLLRYALSCSI